MIPFNINPKNGITVSKVTVTYEQPGDNLPEQLVVSTENYGAGDFIIIHTEANGWSVGNLKEIKYLLEDFMGLCGYIELEAHPDVEK